MNSRRTIVVFTKAPLLGRVKTRIGKRIGDADALALHIELVDRTVATVSRVIGARLAGDEIVAQLSIDGPLDHPDVRRWAGQLNVQPVAQQGADLGERMFHSLAASLQETHVSHDDRRVVLMGTDCPAIDERYLQNAFGALDDADVVLAPAEDGGYGLIGTRQPSRAWFSGLPWSTDRVLAWTVDRIEAEQKIACRLPVIWDVDEVVDVARYRSWCLSQPKG